MREARRGSLLRRLAFGLVWILVPALLAGGLLAVVVSVGATDFDTNVWFPGEAVRAGRSPYPPADLAVLIEPTFLYPPMLLGLDVPLSLLGHDVARGVFWVLEAGSVLMAMRLLGIRDERIYLWTLLSYPVWIGQVLGNPTLLLVLPLALAWRWRGNWWAVALVVGFIGAFKLILWPLGLWLIVTGRIRSAALAAVTAILLVLVPWAVIGFDGFSDYPDLLQIFGEKSGAPRALTLATCASSLGAPSEIAHALRWLCGAAVLTAVVMVARRPDGDRRSFSLAVATVLVISPVVERVYFALLLVPLALAQPTFGFAWSWLRALWLMPVLPNGPRHTVVDDGQVLSSHGFVPTAWQLLVALGFLAVAVATIGRRSPGGHAERAGTPDDGDVLASQQQSHAGVP